MTAKRNSAAGRKARKSAGKGKPGRPLRSLAPAPLTSNKRLTGQSGGARSGPAGAGVSAGSDRDGLTIGAIAARTRAAVDADLNQRKIARNARDAAMFAERGQYQDAKRSLEKAALVLLEMTGELEPAQ